MSAPTSEGHGSAAMIRSMVTLMSITNLQDTFCLGFLCYSSIMTMAFDSNLIKILFKRIDGLTRAGGTAYFASKLIGQTYFLSALMVAAPFADCSAITRYNQVIFYLTRLFNLWLFCTKMLTVWKEHKQFYLILGYAVSGMMVIFGLSIACIFDGKIGTKMQPIGCVYIIQDKTLPKVAISVLHALACVLFQLANMILTSKRGVSSAIISNRVGLRAKMDPFVRQGFHYWFIDLLVSILYIFVPVTVLRSSPFFVMSGMILFTGMDIELSGLIFQSAFAILQEKPVDYIDVEMVPSRSVKEQNFVKQQHVRFEAEFGSKESIHTFASDQIYEPTPTVSQQVVLQSPHHSN